jgi:hypothetical protein
LHRSNYSAIKLIYSAIKLIANHQSERINKESMSAQTLKMKGKLEKIKKGRDLDMEMVKSRIGMMNLTKGLSKKEGEGLSGRMSIDQPDGKRYF